jgi:hypothetical protein
MAFQVAWTHNGRHICKDEERLFMLQITYADGDGKIAEQMQHDLSEANLRLQHRILIVLISPDSVVDDAVRGSINKAVNEKYLLAAVILQEASLPKSLENSMSLDLLKGYNKDKLIQFVNQVDIGAERLKRNRRWLFYMVALVLLVFVVSIATLASGLIAVPLDEFSTERALQDAQIETVVAPQLEAIRPRTTEDAENFPATVEAANNSLQPLMIGTATAILLERLATDTARETAIIETSTAQAEVGD